MRAAEVRVEIQGHTDDVGDPRRNQRLSERRAEAVKQWLVSHGIAAARLTTRGLGEAQPGAEARRESGWLIAGPLALAALVLLLGLHIPHALHDILSGAAASLGGQAP